MKIYNREIKSLVKSFAYAFRGLWFCVKNERNMRIHIVSAVIILFFAFIFELTRVEYSLLILVLGLVMVCELINTAIEALVNLGSPSYDSLARIAKDVAAGAVLMCAIAAVAVGVALFGKWDKLMETFVTIFITPPYWIGFVAIIGFGLVFIFKGVSNVRVKKPTFMKTNDEVKIYRPEKKKRKPMALQKDEDVKLYQGGKSDKHD